jgi:hypothetical protein
MRDFLTLQLGRIPNIGEVYSEFKEYVISNRHKTMYDIVTKIHHYSKFFVKLAYANEYDEEIHEVIHDINELKVEV